MTQRLHSLFLKLLTAAGFAVFLLAALTSPLNAQQALEKGQFKSLRSDVGIVGFNANIHWYNYYLPSLNGLERNSNTELKLQFQNIRMVSAHVVVGYKAFANIYVTGFFEGFGVGSGALGPMLRYYPLETVRWQPYLQAGALIGLNLALS